MKENKYNPRRIHVVSMAILAALIYATAFLAIISAPLWMIVTGGIMLTACFIVMVKTWYDFVNESDSWYDFISELNGEKMVENKRLRQENNALQMQIKNLKNQ